MLQDDGRGISRHTCSWCDKLIVLWTLIRKVKIYLHIYWISAIGFSLIKRNLKVTKIFCKCNSDENLNQLLKTDARKPFSKFANKNAVFQSSFIECLKNFGVLR